MGRISNIIISCEHGGNQIPTRYRTHFDEETLRGAMAWDEGALDVALSLSEKIDAPCFAHQTSRLLIDVDLDLGNKDLFYLSTKFLSDSDRQNILERYYFPYRQRLESAITFSGKPLLHISVHSSVHQTPDIILTYNDTRSLEGECASVFIEHLSTPNGLQFSFEHNAKLADESFVGYLSQRFDADVYAACTLTVHPRFVNNENILALVDYLSIALKLLRS